MNGQLSKEDYEEPRCLLDMHPERASVPTDRIIEKLDSYLDKNDYVSAEKHLDYWLGEAVFCGDRRGELSVLNEQIGLYRKTRKKDEGLDAVSRVLALSADLDMENTVTYGTTLINAATCYKAFGLAEKALPLYVRAREIYEKDLPDGDSRLGGLYNNMALALCDLKDYGGARGLYEKALGVMSRQTHGEAEMAVTYLNLADLTAAEKGIENTEAEIEEYITKAEELLDCETLPRNGYYAFVCEKCAPVFGYYGYFLTENKLNVRAREIYERS